MNLAQMMRISASAWIVTSAITSAAMAQDFDGPGSDDAEADGGDWSFFIGAGVEYEPEYEGSDVYETSAMPGFQAVWRDRFMISPMGLGAFIINEENFRLSAAVGYGGGRKESDSPYLRGMGDIDDGAEISLGMQYDLGGLVATADVRKFTSGSKGTLVSFGLQSEVPFGVALGALLPTGTNISEVGNERGLVLTGGMSVDWGDEKYNQSFFGVNAAQSASSGLTQYSAGSGAKSVNLDLGFAKPLGKNWGLTGGVTYSRLLGDVADSPLVKSDNSLSASLFVGFNF